MTCISGSRWVAPLFAAALIWCGAVHAQDAVHADATAGPDIVVNGQRDRTLRQLLQAMAPPRAGRQLARWDDRICVKVIGLRDPYAAMIRARIETMARAVKVDVAKSNRCRGNVTIVFTADADRLAAEIVRTYPDLVGETDRGGVNRRSIAPYLSPQPVRWFGAEQVKAEELPLASRITANSRQVVSQIYVIVDADRIGGVTWGHLADFLTFVSLARPRFDHRYDDPDTILSLFTARDAGVAMPNGLTAVDRAFLTALYETRPSQTADGQRQDIHRRVKAKSAGR